MKTHLFSVMVLAGLLVLEGGPTGCSSDSGGSDAGAQEAEVGALPDQGGVEAPAVDLGTGSISSALVQCTPPTHRLVITEVMIRPTKVSDQNGEWIEIHNPFAEPVNLQNWRLKDATGQSHVIQSSVTINGGAYVVLCINAQSGANGGVTCNYQYADFTLSNDGPDNVELVDPQGSTVYSVSWTGSAPAGASVAIKNPFFDVNGASLSFGASGSLPPDSNWAISTASYGAGDKGTPGAKNSDVYVFVEDPTCSDGKLCTYDLCEAGTCSNPWKNGCCTSQEAAPNECDDGNPCTSESCNVEQHACIYTPIENCCTNNEDCADENPCNYDWCAYDEGAKGYRCRHSVNIVSGCCYAPNVNPATGQPWDPADQTTWALPGTGPNGVPDAREAYGALQCDDKQSCTPNGCDVVNNVCKFGERAPNCCDLDVHCDDGDACTYDFCVDHACVHNLKSTLCCTTDAECKARFYENECYQDVCVGNTCRHIFNIENCCPNDQWCADNRDDGNKCTMEKCVVVNPTTGERTCQHVYVTECTTECPYFENFNSAASFQQIGWSIYDYGTKATVHWLLDVSGELGPDKFVKFVWNPTTPTVQSVVHTPRLDCHTADPDALPVGSGDIYNKFKKTTVQWRMRYKHAPGGGPVTLRAVVTDDDWITWTPIKEWLNVTEDLEYGLVSVQIPGTTLWKSTNLRLGFMVDTGTLTTFDMDNLQIDDVKIGGGLPNEFASAQIVRCHPGTPCENPNDFDLICDTLGSWGLYNNPKCQVKPGEKLPDLTLEVCDWYRVYMCVDDPDAYYWTWFVYGFPYGYMEGAPLDPAPFVHFLYCNQSTGSFCPPGTSKSLCVFEVKPECQENYAGSYRSGVVVGDEYTKPGAKPHSLFESMTKLWINVLLGSGYVVWSPNGTSDPAAVALRDGIAAAGRKVQIVRDIGVIPDLTKYSGVFAVLGVHGRYYKMKESEAARLKAYLDAGGKVYVEGGDFWYTQAVGGQPYTVLHPYFRVTATSDGLLKTPGPVVGRNFLWGMNFDLDQSADLNSWNDQMLHSPGQGGREVLRVGDDKTGWATAVTYESSGATKYRTIATSFPLAALIKKKADGSIDPVATEAAQKALVAKWVYFLENGYPPCSDVKQCDDFEVCTQDSCTQATCVNAKIPNCIECMDDLYQWDGVTPSCGPDQACDVARGYCVDIDPLVYTSKTVKQCSPQVFGASPVSRECAMTVVTPGVVQDLQVKVKVPHAYRGDVKLSLKSPSGAIVQLKAADPNDSRENVYATFDLGVPLPAGSSLDTFNDTALNGTWVLTATDNFPPLFNGALEEWKIYGKYAPIQCDATHPCPDTPCMTWVCLNPGPNGQCKYTPFNCDDGDACTTDSCDPETNQCVHKAKPSCSCTSHADCESPDDVCLIVGTNQACTGGDVACQCTPICPADEPTCKTLYVLGGLPLNIPDNNPGGTSLTRTVVPAEAKGVLKRLWVKVQTQHPATGDLKAELCHEGTCVTLHNHTGGNTPGFWHVYSYDPEDGPGTLDDFLGTKVGGDWTLKLYDLVQGDSGKLMNWTLYVVTIDCFEDSDCDDGNKCTIDKCETEGPVFPVIPVMGLVGNGGTCKHITIQCAPSSDPCFGEQCNPSTGQCEPMAQPNGTPCDDHLFCTVNDTCLNGQCRSGPPRSCSSLDDPNRCIVGQCDEELDLCIPAQAPENSQCDDNNVCTDVDRCNSSGQCVGSVTPPGVCPCQTDADCDDKDLCNGTMRCDLNTHMCVVDQGPKDCGPASGPCKVMRCIPSTGQCVEQNALPGTPCEDGLYCTVGDTCQLGGVCQGTAERDCSGLDDACNEGVCDEESDSCVAEPKPDGTPCEEGDPAAGCTVEVCSGGECVLDHEIECAEKECKEATCEPVGYNGYQCVYENLEDGTPCLDDNDECTEDRCTSGTCTHTKMVSCPGVRCGGNHDYDAGDAMCGLEDSCVGGISGYPNGMCTPTCPTCAKAESGPLALPISEKIQGGTVSSVTLSTQYQFVEEAEVKIRLEHEYLGDLVIELIDPRGWVHTLWNNIGGPRRDFSNTFDLSFPVPLSGNIESGVPMCALRGEQAQGTWWLHIVDKGTGNSGVLREWKLYVKGSNATDLNPGHRCQEAIDFGTIDIDPARTVVGTTACGINVMSSSCGGQNGVERLYKFTLTTPKRVTITLRQPDRDLILFVKKAIDGVPCDAPNLCSQPGAKCYCSQQVGQWGPGNKPDEVFDGILWEGTYYLGVDTNAPPYYTGPFSFDIRLVSLRANGEPCLDDKDCGSEHCQNGYCCMEGDCCPSHPWPVPPNGTDPDVVKSNPDWISANVTVGEKCPDQYRENPTCTDPATCQGARYDAMCVDFQCQKVRVDDDSACTTSVKSDECGYWLPVYCGSVGPAPFTVRNQTEPPCPTWCDSDAECDPNAHCDPPDDPTKPDTPGSHTMTCQADRPNGATCNDPDDSDCISGHCQNGYCCNFGDCCPTDDKTGADTCPASYEQAPVCAQSATCEGYRYDKTCINNQCGSVYVHDDCACANLVAFECGYYLPRSCPPAPRCPATDPWNGILNPPTTYHPDDPACPTTCLVGSPPQEDDSMCLDIAHCDPDIAHGHPENSVCVANVPDGGPCNENSDCANKLTTNAPTGHCQNGFCCIAGDCCSVNTDCPTRTPPGGWWGPAVCDDQTTCQGHRTDATCINFMCGSRVVDDDSGCTPDKLANDCGYYLPIYCTGQADQPVPQCPTSCPNNDDAYCDPNAHCDGICVADLPNDEPCDENSDCISNYCQIHFCCSIGDCCKGCKVTSFTPNLAGGGTDDMTQSGQLRVQSSFGQPSPAGSRFLGVDPQCGQAGHPPCPPAPPCCAADDIACRTVFPALPICAKTADLGFWPGAAQSVVPCTKDTDCISTMYCAIATPPAQNECRLGCRTSPDNCTPPKTCNPVTRVCGP